VACDVVQGVHNRYTLASLLQAYQVLGEELPNSELRKPYLLNGVEENAM
jgi:hypothetical protein